MATFTIIDVRCIAKVAGKAKLYITSNIKTQMNLAPFCFWAVSAVLNIPAYFAKVFHFLCLFFKFSWAKTKLNFLCIVGSAQKSL